MLWNYLIEKTTDYKFLQLKVMTILIGANVIHLCKTNRYGVCEYYLSTTVYLKGKSEVIFVII